jgi:glucan biosynthesis protein C
MTNKKAMPSPHYPPSYRRRASERDTPDLAENEKAPMRTNGRQHDIDWLRVLAMFMIFLFHSARFFDESGWHVKNNQLSFVMSVFVGIVSQWIMPLFFILSAISTYYALNIRTNAQYVGERFKRLFVPLAFGTLTLIPPQVYIERVTQSGFTGSFFDFYPRYFDGYYGFGGNFAWMGLHLWYLEVLFVFSVLTLPLFRNLKKAPLRAFIAHLTDRPVKWAVIFLPAFCVALMEMIVNLQPQGIGIRDFGGWSPLTYLVFFVLGYLMACDDRLHETVAKQRLLASALAILSTAIGYFMVTSGHSSRSVPLAFLRGFNSWFWLMAILGYAHRYLQFSNRLLAYANTAVLPFYILHQTVIVIIGFYLVHWDAGVMLKYAALSTTSFVVIMALYELVVKRFWLLRFLFGMKPGLKTNS